MSTATLPVAGLRERYETLDDWLGARPSFVGASESPALCGEGYRDQSEVSIWAEKTGRMTADRDDESLEAGHFLQPAILSLFAHRSGLPLHNWGEFTVIRSVERPYVGATLDGVTVDADGPAVVEAKNVSQWNAGDWESEPPLRVQVQVQHQLYCTGWNRGYVVGLVGGNRLVWRACERNDAFIDALLRRLDAFWRYVQADTAPPIDGSEATAQALKHLYPESNGMSVVLPASSIEWDAELTTIKAELKKLEARQKELENLIKAAIGPNELGLLPNGGAYTHKTQTNRYPAREAYETSFRVLRRRQKA